MPFILFTGWMLTGVESGPADPELAQRATLLLSLGFAFLLAVVPFHTWIPLLTEEADPYPAGFVFTIFPVVIFFLSLTFLDGYVWLRENANLFPLFRLVGTMMVVVGGGLALFQNHLGRMMGFAVIMVSGFLMMSIGLGSQGGFELFSGQLIIRFIAFWLWSLSLAVIAERGGEFTFGKTGAFLARFPFASVGLLLSHLSLAGFPLLAGFPTRLTLFILMAQQEPGQIWWIFAGNLGLMAAALRTLAGLSDRELLAGKRMEEKPTQVFLLILGMVLLLVIGWFPQLFLAEAADLVAMFQHLVAPAP
jgi:NADH:ubiquinone oxidoreductase subunit 2 (subunit N)